MTTYDITLSGCDDSTRIHNVPLTTDELTLLGRVADLAVTAVDGCGCKPTMRVEVAPESPPDGEVCCSCWEQLDGSPPARDEYGQWVHQQCPADDGATS